MQTKDLSQDAALIVVDLKTFKRAYFKAFIINGTPHVEMPLPFLRGDKSITEAIEPLIDISMLYLDHIPWYSSSKFFKKSYTTSLYKYTLTTDKHFRINH